jgi:hypothetical protein
LKILTTLPTFPLLSDILTKHHVVGVFACKLPTDGIGLKLHELDNDFEFVRRELMYFFKINLNFFYFNL